MIAQDKAVRPTLYVIPQSHIDVVWLWRFDPETIHRCCKPTFERATSNLERFPEYTFCQSQVPLYEVTERVYPALFGKIEKYIREGRWEIVGGMYVEPEGGEPGGEALVRQCVLGKRYFQRRFGVNVTTGWLPDTWSHPWQLPQILSKCGMNSYMFRRGRQAHRLFWWQSPDGSRVLACRPFTDTPIHEWRAAAETIKQQYGVTATMIEIGRGDHGGGLDPDEIEAIQKFAKEAAPDVAISFSTFSQYVRAVLDQHPDLPVTNNELEFQLHGDLTNCGWVKKNNRDCENLLLATEKWCSAAHMLLGQEYPAEELELSWQKLLFNQFHDILGGSLIPPAHDDTMVMYRSIHDSGAYLTDEAIKAIAERVDTEGSGTPVLVFNPLSWARHDVVEAELDLGHSGTDDEIQSDEFRCLSPNVQVLDQRTEHGHNIVQCLFIPPEVPSVGYTTLHVTSAAAEKKPSSLSVSSSPPCIGNQIFRVDLDPASGWITRILDKRSNREVLDGSQKGVRLIAIQDEGDSEGRFVMGDDTVCRPPGEVFEMDSPASIQVLEQGPVRAALRVEKTFRNSKFIQDIRLYNSLDRIDFELTIDWHDIHTMIKAVFPLNLSNPTVTYDAPYATIVRPADGMECSAQKWVDLSSAGYGVALLNNGRYGYDVQGNILRMSILRSPTEPARNTDEGQHVLGYSLCPHAGTWQEADVLRRGYEFNFPLVARVERAHDGSLPAKQSFFAVEPGNVLLEAVKKAYDSDGLILRLCELHGQDTTARIALSVPIQSAVETDLLENPIRELPVAGKNLTVSISAHEIKTVKVVTGASS